MDAVDIFQFALDAVAAGGTDHAMNSQLTDLNATVLLSFYLDSSIESCFLDSIQD